MFLCSCICWPHRFLCPVYLNSFRSECSKNIRVIFSEYDFVLEEAYFSISSWRVHMYLCINWHHNIENCFNLSVLVMNSLLCKVFWHSGWVLLQFFKHRNLPFFFSKFWQHICKGYGIFFGLFACTFLTFFSPFFDSGMEKNLLTQVLDLGLEHAKTLIGWTGACRPIFNFKSHIYYICYFLDCSLSTCMAFPIPWQSPWSYNETLAWVCMHMKTLFNVTNSI